MSTEPLIFEVSETGFERYVLENSRHLPVLVEFMGMWSEPSAIMADKLAVLAREFAGRFVFVKVDIDEQTALRERYAIKNIPTLIVFRDAEMMLTQEGQFDEAELRVMLRGVGVFHESDELREQARAKHMAGDSAAAIMLLTEAIQKDPRNTRVAMDMVQVLLDIGQLDSAKDLFNKLPSADRESEIGKSLLGQITFIDLAASTEGVPALTARLAMHEADHAAHFDLAICLVSQHDYAGAMEHLFRILKEAPDFKEGAARELIIALSNMLATNAPAEAQRYRQQLASSLH